MCSLPHGSIFGVPQEDRQIRQEIVAASRESYGIRYPVRQTKKSSSQRSLNDPNFSATFLTEEG